MRFFLLINLFFWVWFEKSPTIFQLKASLFYYTGISLKRNNNSLICSHLTKRLSKEYNPPVSPFEKGGIEGDLSLQKDSPSLKLRHRRISSADHLGIASTVKKTAFSQWHQSPFNCSICIICLWIGACPVYHTGIISCVVIIRGNQSTVLLPLK